MDKSFVKISRLFDLEEAESWELKLLVQFNHIKWICPYNLYSQITVVWIVQTSQYRDMLKEGFIILWSLKLSIIILNLSDISQIK